MCLNVKLQVFASDIEPGCVALARNGWGVVLGSEKPATGHLAGSFALTFRD